jgi:prolyl-tRNA synthetase
VATAIQRYSEFYHRLAIPYLIVRRPDWDKFPGADYTIALDTVMPDGRTLQIGTAHHLSSNFAKTFGITYENPEGEQVLVNQTCYGISERCIAALISVHGDDTGLILPWAVAPLQVVVVPIIFAEKERVLELCRSYQKRISDAGIRVRLDESDDRPGAKFYRWELSGVPIRIEVGPRDMERGAVTLVRRDGRKIAVPKDELIAAILAEANDLQLVLAEKAKKFMESLIRDCYTVDEARDQIRVGIAKVAWCGSEDCGHKLEDEIGASILGVPEGSNEDCKSAGGGCIICGMDTGICAFMARQY